MKKLLTLIMVVICLITLCGCGKKQVLSDKDISSKLSQMGFSVNDVTSSMEDSNVNVVKTANNGKYQIEYYVFKSEQMAKTAYDNNIAMFKDNKKYKGNERSKDGYNRYDQKTDDYYNVVSRLGNTLVYASVNIDYKNDLKKVLNKLNF